MLNKTDDNGPETEPSLAVMEAIIANAPVVPEILLVDDVQSSLFAMKAVLSDLDTEIVTASSGQDVLSLALQHDFAVIVMDVNMPGMSGHDTATLLRGNEHTRPTPILFVTGVSRDDAYIFRGYDAGAVDYLLKPVNPHILRSKVSVFLELYRYRKAVDVVDQLEREIAERKQIERSLRERSLALARSNAELEQFAYVASHDLRAPLRAIDNLSQWIEDDLKECMSDGTRTHFALLRSRVHRMERMIDDILAYSRAGRCDTAIETVDVQRLLTDIIDVQNVPDHFTITVNGAMPTLYTYRTAMQQVLSNLISNAIKHHGSDTGRVDISVRDADRFYEFTVADDGQGIPPEFHERVFAVFQTLKPRDEVEGSGVGLALVKKLMESVGGSVQLRSDLGHGAAFVIRWPKKATAREELCPILDQ